MSDIDVPTVEDALGWINIEENGDVLSAMVDIVRLGDRGQRQGRE